MNVERIARAAAQDAPCLDSTAAVPFVDGCPCAVCVLGEEEVRHDAREEPSPISEAWERHYDARDVG